MSWLGHAAIAVAIFAVFPVAWPLAWMQWREIRLIRRDPETYAILKSDPLGPWKRWRCK